MAAQGKRVVVSSTPVKIASKGCRVVLRNRDAANDVDLGGANVAAGAGFRLLHTDTLATEVDCQGDDLYAIRSAAADATIDVLITRAAN